MIALVVQTLGIFALLIVILLIVGWLIAAILSLTLYGAEEVVSRIVGERS